LASVANSEGCSIQKYNIVCFLYGCDAGSDTVREEQRSRELGKGALRTIFELREGKYPHEGETHIMRTFILVFFVKHDELDNVINDERGGGLLTCVSKMRNAMNLGGENLKGRGGKSVRILAAVSALSKSMLFCLSGALAHFLSLVDQPGI
jgi:hypothetical protein